MQPLEFYFFRCKSNLYREIVEKYHLLALLNQASKYYYRL